MTKRSSKKLVGRETTTQALEDDAPRRRVATQDEAEIINDTCPRCQREFTSGIGFVRHLLDSACGQALHRQFAERVEIPPPTAAQAEARSKALVHRGPSGEAVLALRRDEEAGSVVCVIQPSTGTVVEVHPLDTFDLKYRPMADYPPGRCAKLMVSYATTIGGTSHALAELETLIHISDEDKHMAAEKLDSNKSATKTIVTTDERGNKVAKKERAPRNTASSMFQALIMEGKLSDEEIFQAVFKATGKGKENHVAWYRAKMKKDGKNPPAKVESKEKIKERADKEAAAAKAKADKAAAKEKEAAAKAAEKAKADAAKAKEKEAAAKAKEKEAAAKAKEAAKAQKKAG